MISPAVRASNTPSMDGLTIGPLSYYSRPVYYFGW